MRTIRKRVTELTMRYACGHEFKVECDRYVIQANVVKDYRYIRSTLCQRCEDAKIEKLQRN